MLTTGGLKPYIARALRAEQPRPRVGVHALGVLAQLVDDAGILRVAVREVGGPHEAVRCRRAARAPARCVSPGSKLIQHWRWKYSLGVSDSGGRRPAVALEELVEPVHPVRDPAAAALEHDDLQLREAFEHAAVDEVRERHLLVEQQDQRVVRARRHQVRRARCDAPGMSARPAGWNAIGRPVSLERFPDRRVRPDGAAAGRCTRSGRAKPAFKPERRDAVRLVGRALRDPASGARRRPTSRSGACAHHSAIQSL